MPYEGEYAKYKPLGRVIQSPRVRELLGTYELRDPSKSLQELPRIRIADTRPSLYQPSLVLAVDGNHTEVPVKTGFPGAEASYVTIASILIDLERMRYMDQHRPVDPKAFRTIQQEESIDCALPGCNVILKGQPTAEASLRRAVFDVLDRESMTKDGEGESLLDTYEALLGFKPTTGKQQDCPYAPDCEGVNKAYKRGQGCYDCGCTLKRPLYSTDALRFHERLMPGGSNGEIYAEVMTVLERLWVVHVLRTLERRGWLAMMRRVAVVIDGPLAVFGQPAWLSQAISRELMRINDEFKRIANMDLLILGVEKTGLFVDHFALLDIDEKGEPDRFPTQSAGLLSDPYIKRNVIASESKKPYGQDTYFGRKFLYKTRNGARIVATLPYLHESHRDVSKAEEWQYPRLGDAMALLDELVSSRYPDSLTPLVAANAEAAIPLHLGSKALERLARELIKEEKP